MNFLVTVLCAAHLHSCPIPGGYTKAIQADNKQHCEKLAKEVISTLGLATADFRVSCKAK
jgi:hypothetical protein